MILGGLFRGSVQSREIRDTRELLDRVRGLYAAHPLSRMSKASLTEELLGSVFLDAPSRLAGWLTPTVRTVVEVLIDAEGLFDIPTVPEHVQLGLEEGARLRAALRAKERFYANPRLFERWWEI